MKMSQPAGVLNEIGSLSKTDQTIEAGRIQ